MFTKLHNPNEIFNKITKNFNFDPNNGKIIMSSPEPPDQHYFNRVRVHTLSNDDKPPKLIPINEKNSELGSKEMNDIAFEVTIDKNNQNVHPLDEPFILRNGKKLFPTDNTKNNNFNNNINDSEKEKVTMDDLINLVQNIFKFLKSSLITFWNLDLYFNIVTSENSTMKIHIPSVVMSLIGLKVLFSLIYPSKKETLSFIPSESPKSSSFFLSSILPLIILVPIISYWYICYQNSNDSNTAKNSSYEPISETATLIGSVSNNSTPDLIPDIDCISTTSDPETLIDSTENGKYYSIKGGNIKDGKTIQLETILNQHKEPIEKLFHPVHRQEMKQKYPRKKLNLNLPNENVKKNKINNGFDEMTRLGRQEMLKAFNI